MKINMEVSQKTEIELPHDLGIPLLAIYPREWRSAYNGDTDTST
jgi:hypothetical protein